MKCPNCEKKVTKLYVHPKRGGLCWTCFNYEDMYDGFLGKPIYKPLVLHEEEVG